MNARERIVIVVTCHLLAIGAIRCSSNAPNHGVNAGGGSPGIASDAGAQDAATANTGDAAARVDASLPTDAAVANPCSNPPLYVCDTSTSNPNFDCDITDFGAVGDGSTDDTCAVQAAIDYCAKIAKCYGNIATVHVPAGNYLVMPLVLRSNLTLKFDGSVIDGGPASTPEASTTGTARIQFVADPNKYAASGGVPIVPGLINGTTVTNVTITGQGIIDGAGARWWALYNSTWSSAGIDPRPYLISITSNSSNITISGVTVQNSPKFHVFLQNSSNIDIHGITIRAPFDSPNTDGIDPKSCMHVTISDCDISTGDDNVAISSNSRAGVAPPTSNDTEVYNCRFGAGHGVSIGSPTYGDVGGVNVHDCAFDGTDNGIRIKSNASSGGIVDGIAYSNLQMTNVTNVIVLDEYYNDKADIPPLDAGVNEADSAVPVSGNEPQFRNISISNLTATNCGTAGVIRGRVESPISKVSLENVSIAANNGLTIRFAEGIQFVNSAIVTPVGVPAITLEVDPSAVIGLDAMLDAGVP